MIIGRVAVSIWKKYAFYLSIEAITNLRNIFELTFFNIILFWQIIPYIASQFRKDKIWLRRTKPAQRDYKITIAIDDSKSMDYNNSKDLTLQAISLVSQALTLLESGQLSIMSFGESPKIILNHTDQFDGPTLVNSLNFAQNQSRIADLMEFVRVANSEDTGSSSDNGIFENLLLVLSDGRNIFSEGERKVRNAIKLARLSRMFIVYIIIDNPENKVCILEVVEIEADYFQSVCFNLNIFFIFCSIQFLIFGCHISQAIVKQLQWNHISTHFHSLIMWSSEILHSYRWY